MHYHSYMLGVLIGAFGIAFGMFQSKRSKKPYEYLEFLHEKEHPLPAIRFYKVQIVLIDLLYYIYDNDTVEKLLTYFDDFTFSLFLHNNGLYDIKNCYWMPALTKEAQEWICKLDKGWNIIRDDLQKYSFIELPGKIDEELIKVNSGLIWFDKFGNKIIENE